MKKRGFTLVEILVVLAIIAILAALLFPVFTRAKEGGRQTNCATNLQQIYVAVQQYYADEKRYPASLADMLPKDVTLNNVAALPVAPGSGCTVAPNAAVGCANEKGRGDFKGGLEALICHDDDTLSDVTRSSYGDVSNNINSPTTFPLPLPALPAANARANAYDLGRYVWNYWGYGKDGFAFIDGSEAATAAAAAEAVGKSLVVVPGTAWARNNPIKFSLSNRYAPSGTIITHCIYHRLPTSNLDGPGKIYSDATNGAYARDIILRLDGSAKALDVSKFWNNDPAATTQSLWQLQSF